MRPTDFCNHWLQFFTSTISKVKAMHNLDVMGRENSFALCIGRSSNWTLPVLILRWRNQSPCNFNRFSFAGDSLVNTLSHCVKSVQSLIKQLSSGGDRPRWNPGARRLHWSTRLLDTDQGHQAPLATFKEADQLPEQIPISIMWGVPLRRIMEITKNAGLVSLISKKQHSSRRWTQSRNW